MTSGFTFLGGNGIVFLIDFLKKLVRDLIEFAHWPSRSFWSWRVRTRYLNKRRLVSDPGDGVKGGLELCEVRYINLNHREDRKSQIEEELGKLGVTVFGRVEASYRRNGSLGCAESHAKATSSPPDFGKMLMVCEDDVMFLADRDEIDRHLNAFANDSGIDVLCLGYNIADCPVKVSTHLSITGDTQTASCYVVKPSCLASIHQNLLESVSNLEKGKSPGRFANDIYWKRLQRKQLVFSVSNVRLVVQRPSFSDILRRGVDYQL
jgi:hypothetical protein